MFSKDKNIVVQNDISKSTSIVNKTVLAIDLQYLTTPTYPILHQNARFWYILEGRGKFEIQGRKIDIEPGVLIGVLPWQCTEVIEVIEPIKYYVIVYEFDLVNGSMKNSLNVLKENYDVFGNIYSNTFVKCNEIQSEYVERICNNIQFELGLESEKKIVPERPLNNIFLFTLLVDLCIIFYRASQDKKLSDTNDSKRRRTSHKIEIFHYMYFKLNSRITLQDLSDRYYMSRSAISKYIYDSIGISFNELVSIMRMARLLNYIHFSDMTLKELAMLLGYSDASHISKFFHSKFKMNIAEYKNAKSEDIKTLRIKEYEKCKNVIMYILDNYYLDLTLDEVAIEHNLSNDDVNNILEYFMEKSYTSFLNYVRIIKASEILLKTDKSVSDIALEVGYNNSRTFNRNFMKTYSLSPTEFRKKTKCQDELL